MKRILKNFERSIMFVIKSLMLALMYVVFYILYYESIEDFARIWSQTTIISVFVFLIVGMLFIRIYGGFAVGEKKSRDIIYSIFLAILMTDLITYITLCMLEKTVLPITEMLVIVVGQLLIIIAAAHIGNGFHFMLCPPDDTLIIYGDESKLPVYQAKIGRYKKQWAVTECVHYRFGFADDAPLEEVVAVQREAIRRHKATFVFDVPPTVAAYVVEYCYKHNRKVYISPSVSDIINSNSKQMIVDDMTIFATELSSLSFEQLLIKRVIDIAFSLIGIILSSPLMLFAAIAVKAGGDGPVFYRQERITRGGRKFFVLKFRTMRTDAEKFGAQLSTGEDDPRVTRAGKMLRKTRLDELPQFFNILRGDMSVVGPRPEREEIADEYLKEHPEFKYRLKVKAGLTGLAQILGKYNTDPADKLTLDMLYIAKYSLWLDIKMLLQTFIVLLKKDSTEGVTNQPPASSPTM